MPNTNFQTILQMPGIVNDIVKQATGRNSVSQIDMDFVTVAQDKQTVQHEIDYTAMASFVNNNQLPLTVLAKITAVQSGTGDPAPDNVRPITGWTGVNVTRCGKTDTDTYTFTFLEDPGTVYGGVLNVTTGVLTVDRAIVDLEKGMTGGTTGSGYVFYKTLDNPKIVPNSQIAGIISEAYTPIRFNALPSNINTIAIRDNGAVYVNTGRADITPVGHAIYELATPITYQLTPTEIDSLIGENNLYADTGDVAVSYTSYIPVP